MFWSLFLCNAWFFYAYYFWFIFLWLVCIFSIHQERMKKTVSGNTLCKVNFAVKLQHFMPARYLSTIMIKQSSKMQMVKTDQSVDIYWDTRLLIIAAKKHFRVGFFFISYGTLFLSHILRNGSPRMHAASDLNSGSSYDK